MALVCALAPVGPAASAPPEPWRGLVARELARVLAPAEVERLLAGPHAERVLADLFAGWDGQADALDVRRGPGGVTLETRIGDRRCSAALARAESPIAEPVCEEVVRVDGRRSVRFSPETWADAAPRPPTPPRPPRPRPRPTPPAPTPPEPPSVLVGSGAAHQAPGEPDALTLIRGEHEDFKDRARRAHYRDPLLPDDPVEAGDALTPLSWDPIEQTASDFNLKNPFDEARMRTALPMPSPAITGLGTSVDAPPLVPDLRPECTAQWSARELGADPPTLDCYRRVAYHARLEKKDLHKALGPLAGILRIPVLDFLLEAEMRSAVSPRSHGPVWAVVWLEWTKKNPERTAEALDDLTPEERRLLRRRIAGWWVDADYAAWRGTITTLLERHFVRLYPESKDLDGLPRRAFLTDTWLWANNWLSGVDARAEPAIAAAYARLPAAERKVIDTLLADPAFRARFARASLVLAGR
ncbi:MAG: hypothetical protein IT385_25815 [Deltaproteobacteria bacterium]|nr:hypothetical protein [Deltaproteobacteria bacterium]